MYETIGWGYCFLAMVKYLHNDLASAERYANIVQEQRHACEPFSVAQSAFVLASLQQARGLSGEARSTLENLYEYSMETRSEVLLPLVQAFSAELAARQGDLDTAGRWAATVGPETPFGIMAYFYAPQLTLPKALLAINTHTSRKQAVAVLSSLHAYVTETHNTRFTIDVLALQSLLDHAEGNEPAALQALEQAVSLAQPGGLIRTFVDLGPRIAPLLVRLRSNDATGYFIDQILEALAAEDNDGVPIRLAAQSVLVEPLTAREMDVLELLAQRLTDKEIAAKLYISKRTVMRHTANLYQKLGVNNRRDAVAAARAFRILPS